jgi:exodeoxyribonuclease-5
MSWSPQQDAALKAVADWLRRGDRPVFRLFGYAGTGKTTLAKHIAEGVDGEVVFGAYTGKAALVLRSRGCTDASTIHSLIYRSREGDENGPQFVLNRSSSAAKADLIIIDECSMVDEELGRDLLSFGRPVLVLGDPAQLPPVKGGGFFTEAEPDVMLTEVHRQAQDNPIVHLSMQVREGGRLEPGIFGESRIIRRREIDATTVMGAGQVLVGLNKTRRLYNGRIRELLGFRDPMPAAGEKLVCLRNDKTKGLLNGGTWTIQTLRGIRNDYLRMDVIPEEEGRRRAVEVQVLKQFFEGTEEEIPFILRGNRTSSPTATRSRSTRRKGSQWDNWCSSTNLTPSASTAAAGSIRA